MPETRTRPPRTVCVGDLNAAADALVEVLYGTGLIDQGQHWIGGTNRLIQMGDIFNRGNGARAALETLMRLRVEARAVGGDVIVLLGNHEVMTVLGNEAYCTVGEYLAFATRAERAAWPARVKRAFHRIYGDYPAGGPVPPFAPRLDQWLVANAPGRLAMRRALGPRGRMGRFLRSLPIATTAEGALFVHAGILPAWARVGVDGLNRIGREAWAGAPVFWGDLPRRSILRAAGGPILSRELSMGEGRETEAKLRQSLALTGTSRMVVGHTITRRAPGGEHGRILSRFDGRLILVDVGMREGRDSPRAALVIEGRNGFEWTPAGRRQLWSDEVPRSTTPIRSVGRKVSRAV